GGVPLDRRRSRPDHDPRARRGGATGDDLGARSRRRARALLDRPADARGHLPGADRLWLRPRTRLWLWPWRKRPDRRTGGTSMSPVLTPSVKRDLGLVLWQIRYEQRAYWRNRGRGIFTFVFPLMFLAIFASVDKGAHVSTRGGIPYDDFFVPGILA